MRVTLLTGILLVLMSQREIPLIDGHYSLPRQADTARSRAGQVGAQFWSLTIPPSMPGPEALRAVLEQFDLFDQIMTREPATYERATTADDIEHIFKAGKIAALLGVDGGQSIDRSLSVLRALYKLGVRSMTPETASCETTSANAGLDPFGASVVNEMNWLGMLVDLSRASNQATLDILRVTKAPVIFSRGGGCPLLPDETLRKVRENGGIVMVPMTTGALDEIDRIRTVAGIDHIGIASGSGEVAKFPDLTPELLRRNYSADDVNKIVGLNMLRVMREVERVSDKLHGRE